VERDIKHTWKKSHYEFSATSLFALGRHRRVTEQVRPLLLLPKDIALHVIILGTAVSHKVQNRCSSTDFKYHSTLAWGTRVGEVVLMEEHVVLPLSNSASLSTEAGMQRRYEKCQHST